MAKQKATAKSADRGKFLTIMLILLLLGQIYGLYAFAVDEGGYRTDMLGGTFNSLLMIIEFFMAWASLYGIWKFKKWGVYLYIISVVISLLAYLFGPSRPSASPALTIFVTLFMSGIFAIPLWAIKRKWHLFK